MNDNGYSWAELEKAIRDPRFFELLWQDMDKFIEKKLKEADLYQEPQEDIDV